MTWAHMWPLLAVGGAGLLLILTAVVLHARTDEDSDAGCLVWVLGFIGVILLWQSADHITTLMGQIK